MRYETGMPNVSSLVCHHYWTISTSSATQYVYHEGWEYEWSLYADDLLLYKSNLLPSRPTLIDLSDKFGKLSSLTQIFQKVGFMPINANAKSTYFSSVQFKTCTENITYLQFWIMHNHKDLYKANLLPLVSCLKQGIKLWEWLASLCGCISTIKMYVT